VKALISAQKNLDPEMIRQINKIHYGDLVSYPKDHHITGYCIHVKNTNLKNREAF
jgi:hypothetical protein